MDQRVLTVMLLVSLCSYIDTSVAERLEPHVHRDQLRINRRSNTEVDHTHAPLPVGVQESDSMEEENKTCNYCGTILDVMKARFVELDKQVTEFLVTYQGIKDSLLQCTLRPQDVTTDDQLPGRARVPSGKAHPTAPSNTSYAKDCTELYARGDTRTGIHWIQPDGATLPFSVFCEMSYDGWTIIFRRFNGSVNFARSWEEYKNGFGSLTGEHWLGNEKMHLVTSQRDRKYTMYMELSYWNSHVVWNAQYNSFRVEGANAKYRLNIAGFSGTLDFDGLSHHSGRSFSTYDQDNDSLPGSSCARRFGGGWWYSNCHYSNPTGHYKGDCRRHDCIEWRHRPLSMVMFKIKAV